MQDSPWRKPVFVAEEISGRPIGIRRDVPIVSEGEVKMSETVDAAAVEGQFQLMFSCGEAAERKLTGRKRDIACFSAVDVHRNKHSAKTCHGALA